MSGVPGADTCSVTGPDASALHRWERATTVPLLVLAVAFALTYVAQVAEGTEELSPVATVVRAAVYALFVVDYLVRVRLSGAALRYVLTHPLDLLVLLVPLLRPVLILLAALVRRRSLLRGRRHVVRRTLLYLVSVSATLVLFVAVAVLVAERDAPGATITDLGDAVWWAMVTVTTVGYGDLAPVTGTGRAFAVLGMLLGIGVLGTVTATISSQLVSAVSREGSEDGEDDLEAVDLARVLAEVRALRAEVAGLRTVGDPPGPDPAPPAPGPGPPGTPRGR